MRLLVVVALVALALAVHPASAGPDCDTLRGAATNYIETAQAVHKLILWHKQGRPQEQLPQAWEWWQRWLMDPVSLIVGEPEAWEREWIRRYGEVLEALGGCITSSHADPS